MLDTLLNNKKQFYKKLLNIYIKAIDSKFYKEFKQKNTLNIGKNDLIIDLLCKDFKKVYNVNFYKEEIKNENIINFRHKKIEPVLIEPKYFNKITEKLNTKSIDFITCINTFDLLSISQCKIILSEIYKLMKANSYCIIVINKTIKKIISSDFSKFIKNFGFRISEKGSVQNFEDFYILTKTDFD